MKTHTFIEYRDGEYIILKKFLHLDGFDDPVEEKDKDRDRLFYSVNYFYFLCEDQDKTIEVAYEYARQNSLSLIEAYNCRDLRFSDVDEIRAVSDMDKTNEGFHGFLSNFMYAFIYPERYQNHKIFKIDVLVSTKQKYYNLIDYSIDESRDEIIYSFNEKIEKQVRFN